MRLDDLIRILQSEPDRQRVVPFGFRNPHSYRGYYEQLAFEPACDVTIESMLVAAKEALGSTYQGWKGGLYGMTGRTSVWIAEMGSTNDTDEELSAEELAAMLAVARPGSVSPADGGTTDPDLALVVDDIRAVVQADPAGIHPHRSDHLADLLAEYDRRGAELERLRAELASTRRELSESLVAQARLDKLAPNRPEQPRWAPCDAAWPSHPGPGETTTPCGFPAGHDGQHRGATGRRWGTGAQPLRECVLDVCDVLAEAGFPAVGRSIPDAFRAALARSVPSVTAQTEEP